MTVISSRIGNHLKFASFSYDTQVSENVVFHNEIVHYIGCMCYTDADVEVGVVTSICIDCSPRCGTFHNGLFLPSSNVMVYTTRYRISLEDEQQEFTGRKQRCSNDPGLREI